jgi:hypothetical protein
MSEPVVLPPYVPAKPLVRVKDHLYDTLFLPENMPHEISNMFVIPVGCYAGRKIKELEHTNMQMCGCLPAPEEFGVREIQCAFYQGGEWIAPFPGRLKLQVGLRIELSFPTSNIHNPHARSLTHVPPHPYGKGFLELEDRERPILSRLRTMEYFTCILELERKPDIPTDFLAVLIGDHFIYQD